jgi:hypothetical protein
MVRFKRQDVERWTNRSRVSVSFDVSVPTAEIKDYSEFQKVFLKKKKTTGKNPVWKYGFGRVYQVKSNDGFLRYVSVSRLQDRGLKPISFSELCDLYIQDYAKANKSSYVTDETYLKRINAN